MNVQKKMLLAASGAVLGLSALAAAQPAVVTLSGATLLENLVSQRASSIDFIDADGDGIARGYPQQANAPFVDQLAPFELPTASGAAATWSANAWWALSYHAIGSTNGYQELINIGRTYTTTDSLPTSVVPLNIAPQRTDDMVLQRRSIAYYNRYIYFRGGSAFDDISPEFPPTVTFIVNQANPAGLPVRAWQRFVLTAELSGAQEVPANASSATGSATLVIQLLPGPDGVANTADDTNTWTLNVSYAGLSAPVSVAHIHQAPNGTNGPVIVGLDGMGGAWNLITPGLTSQSTGTQTAPAPFPAAQVNNLLAGLTYVNIHSSAFPGGEIRGQLRTATPAGNKGVTALYTSTGGFNAAAERDGNPGPSVPAGVASTSPNDGLTLFGGATNDAAPIDVPATYATRVSGSASPNANPNTAGYGNNPRLAKNPDGTDTTRNNTLASLAPSGTPTVPAANLNRLSPDANTIYDTSIVFAPVAPVVNFGTGLTTITMTDLQYLGVAGRRINGENLVAVTRDSGSGTRNAFDNSRGIDPSWGVGDNVGTGNANSINDALGATFLPSNKGGNNRVELTTANHRLALGYVGPERGIPISGDSASGWLTRGELAIPSVINDIYGGTLPSRPTIAQLLTNRPTVIVENINGVNHSGWVIGGPGVLATFGDPRSAPPEKGGFGWLEPQDSTGFFDINGNSVRDAVEPRPAILNPGMRNVEAAAFVNNITRSIEAYTDIQPPPPETNFTPGELAARRFILTASQDLVQDPTDPVNLIPNPVFNASLKAFVNADPTVVYSLPQLRTFDAGVAPSNSSNSRAGKVPLRRIAANTYSDQALVPAGDSYITQNGTLLGYPVIPVASGPQTSSVNLPIRNLIAGDFNGDGLRNINDAGEMIAAWRQRNGGPVWSAPNASGALLTTATNAGQVADSAGGFASIEILGDFNGDGSFTRADVRYWADGLAISPMTGNLNRNAGFTAVDNAFGGNFFGTTIATGKAYQPGDSRGDVINGSNLSLVTRGGPPIAGGNAGVIDANDVAYVYAQFRQAGITGGADWSNVAEAALFDLSADITGDLVVNQADVDDLVKNILGTCYGDLNFDGAVTITERQTVIANAGTLPATWANGDLNGDGVINAADASLACPQDVNCDGNVTVQDIFDFLGFYFANNPKANINGAGGLTVQDIFDFLSAYFAGPC